MMAVEDIEDAVLGRRPQRDRLASQRFRDLRPPNLTVTLVPTSEFDCHSRGGHPRGGQPFGGWEADHLGAGDRLRPLRQSKNVYFDSE